MTSLKTKIFGIITLIVVTIVSISSLVTLNHQNKTITDIAQRNTAVLTETIKGSITDAMLSGHSSDIRKILSQISNQKLITTLRIIDESGKVLNSANPDEIGKTAFSKALLAYKRGKSGITYIGDNEFVSISPILNSTACSVCHDPSTKILGLLEIETPISYLQGFLADTKRQTFLTATVIIILLLVSIFCFLAMHLDKPLHSLIFSMGQIEEGRFIMSPNFTSSREMNILSRQFNRMVKRLQILMETAVKNEGELVRAQEKLVHHHEIHLMNDQLEEQLREIESLNISLEERIEEIEEANHKIAAFAEKQQKDYLSTIQSLVSAIEASDSYTRGHSERVTHFSLLLARSLNLPPERLCVMERAAILHDIGKIGINFAILNKRGALSPSETHHLREHPAIGMKILEPMDFLDDVRTCIGQHHERYDGMGYPNRHADDALLLESRILAIADAFDAMTSDRPYREAMTVSDAVRELYSNAGTQFDPELVPRFASELAKAGIWLEPGLIPLEIPDSVPLSA
jgi:putative nucleotidyltransferase with HDIG domain